VSTKDNALRIIDSILIDPTCLPVKSPTTNYKHKHNSLRTQTILLNAAHLTQTLLADMEVEGMTNKSVKIGRLRLLSNTYLKQKIEDQIQKQLQVILDKEHEMRFQRKAISTTANHQHRPSKKRKADDSSSSSDGKFKVDDPSIKKDDQSESSSSHLIPIYLRIKEKGICITDQFHLDVDPLHPHLSNPILLATSIAKDMNLPSNMINSIAISISEQTHGLKVPEGIQGLTMTERRISDAPGASASANSGLLRKQVNKAVPTAWKFEDKDENNARSCHGNVGKPDFTLNA